MHLHTFKYSQDNGWSIQTFPPVDSKNTLIIIFAAPDFINDDKPLKELAEYYPNSHMIGCSSAGEILGHSINDKSLSVAIIQFEKTPIKVVKKEILNQDRSFQVGQEIATQLVDNDLKSIFVLSGALQTNGSELVKGLNSIQKENIVITGGLAGDGDRFKQTWVICQGEIYQNHIVAVGLYGEHIQIGHGSCGGWDIFGPERRITHSKNNILYELDNQPALQLYKEYLGERAKGLPSTGLLFPLAIRKDSDDTRQIVRTILGIDEKEQSLIFAGDIPTGYLAQLMRANFDRIITGATEAGRLANSTLLKNVLVEDKPILSIAISCVGRRLLLGERTEEETISTLEVLPEQTQQIGFYSYGEISPYTTGHCDLHNQTMTLTTLSEV